jgi:antitoxin ParD1/3/4
MAGKNTSIALGKPFIEFAQRKVESGEFATTSEVVREAMRRYMDDDAKIMALRAMVQKSIDSGPARPFDWDVFIEKKFGPDLDT